MPTLTAQATRPQSQASSAPNKNVSTPDDLDSPVNWRKIVSKYTTPSLSRSLGQIANTGIPYLGLWVLMYHTVAVSWPLTIALAAVAALFLIRIFIIFHDCGHGSYFKSSRANDAVGFIAGLLTFTPYRHWSWQHAVHHSTSGNLDKRGLGDIWTMTVNEYQAASRWQRFVYRVARNPIVLFGLAPLGLFVIYQRFPDAKAKTRDRKSVMIMNAAIALYVVGMSALFGFWNFFCIQLTITGISGSLGIWLFYMQHQFEGTYWRSGQEWDYTTSAMEGSSFYKLPKILQWFSGNIGFHHIHHLSARIPNYYLEKCHKAEPFFQQVPEVNLKSSMRCMWLRLWDEESQQLISYRQLRQLLKERAA